MQKNKQKNEQKLLVLFKTWKKYKLEMLTLLTGHHVKCVPVGNYSCCSNTDSSYRRYSYLPSEDIPVHQNYSPNQAFGRSSPWWLGERTEGPLGQNVVTALGLVQLPRHKALRPLVPTHASQSDFQSQLKHHSRLSFRSGRNIWYITVLLFIC